MKGLIELSNFDVEHFSSKCTTPSETEGEGEVSVKMYGKSMVNCLNRIFQYEATILFIFDAQQSCRARRALSWRLIAFSNLSK